MENPVYKRVLLKLSGEALMGEMGFGLHVPTIQGIAESIKKLNSLKIEVAVVIGGGNIFRGLKGAAAGMDRATADYMGMLATVINGMALQDAFENAGVPTRLMTAIEMRTVAETYIRRRAERHLAKGRVVIFGAGTGSPYFTTDTTAALRGSEIQADVVMKGTMVDGVYDKDPNKHSDAVRFERLTFGEVIQRDLRVMDPTAVTLCRESSLPILVFDMRDPANIVRAVSGEAIGTLVTD
ncbi:MAG: UMP kinase [Deltaproteobacteria bacterium]|nr:UMP kinase [Deltaproteobacteria bacterium]